MLNTYKCSFKVFNRFYHLLFLYVYTNIILCSVATTALAFDKKKYLQDIFVDTSWTVHIPFHPSQSHGAHAQLKSQVNTQKRITFFKLNDSISYRVLITHCGFFLNLRQWTLPDLPDGWSAQTRVSRITNHSRIVSINQIQIRKKGFISV